MLIEAHIEIGHESHGPHSLEHGFTLAELVVGCVLLSIVCAFVVVAISNLAGVHDDLGVNRAAQRQALDAMEQMRHDIAAARSPALEQWDGRRESMRNIVYYWVDGTAGKADERSRALCGGATGDSYLGCLQDVVVATPREVWFRADVSAEMQGSECVGYGVASGSFMRWESSSWRSCGPALKDAASTRSTMLVEADGLGSDVLSYSIRYNPTMVRNTESDVNECITVSGAAASALLTSDDVARNWITNVEIDLSGISSRRDGSAVAGLKSSMPLNGRIAGDFAYAVGCSY